MQFRACAEHTSGHVTSCDVIFGQGCFQWRHFQQRMSNGPLPFASPEICLQLFRYTTLLFGFGGGWNPLNIPWKITKGRQSSLPLEIYVKGIARALNWRKCLGGIMNLTPTARCQISTLMFENKLWRGSLLISHEKYIKDGKVLAHLGVKLKVLVRSLTDVSAYVG